MKILKLLINLIPNRKIRHNLVNKYFPKNTELVQFIVDKNTKCLMVCPHPDDEMLGCGGTLLKYSNYFDCICMASSGVKTESIDAESRANLRIEEFNKVMQALNIKNHWIFKTFGVPPMINQIEKLFKEYCSVLDTIKYDYIFLPHPKDNHGEHNFITNDLFKRILKKNGYKKDLKIVFYEVWSPISNPNYFEDITEVVEEKIKNLELYKSQFVWINYSDKIAGLNKYRGMLANNVGYAEAFNIISVNKYLKERF